MCTQPVANGAQYYPDTRGRIVIEPRRKHPVQAKCKHYATIPACAHFEMPAASEQSGPVSYASVAFLVQVSRSIVAGELELKYGVPPVKF